MFQLNLGHQKCETYSYCSTKQTVKNDLYVLFSIIRVQSDILVFDNKGTVRHSGAK